MMTFWIDVGALHLNNSSQVVVAPSPLILVIY